MFRVVCSTLVLSVFFSIMNAHAVDRYRVNVKANHNRYTNTSTYDIDVSRTGLRRIQFPEPDESALRNVPTMGETIMQLYREQPYANRANAEANRAHAETNLLNAQADLVRFQLQEAKKQSRATFRTDVNSLVASILFVHFVHGVDVETAGNRYLRAGGNPEILSAACREITRRANEIQARDTKKLPLAKVLNLDNRETQYAYRAIRNYEAKHKLTREKAIMAFLTLNCELSPDEAVSCLKRIRY